MELETTINNIKIKNISIDEISCNSANLYYKKKISYHDFVVENYKTLNNNSIVDLVVQTTDENYRLIVEDNNEDKLFPIPFIFKFKNKNIKTLYNYIPTHIRSSIIKNILFNINNTIEDRIKQMLFILYNYWFFHKPTIKEISLNIIVDIEKIISTIINKSLSIYKNNKDLDKIVSELRSTLLDERLLYEL